jgi:transposase
MIPKPARLQVTPEQHRVFEALLVPFDLKRGRPRRDPKLVLEGIFWVAQNKAPWRSVPEQYGRWNSIQRQYARWSRAGLWSDLILLLEDRPTERLKTIVSWSYIAADLAVVRTCPEFLDAVRCIASLRDRPTGAPGRGRPSADRLL